MVYPGQGEKIASPPVWSCYTRLRRWQGFSFLECLLAIAIIGLIGSLGARIVAVGWDTFAFHTRTLDADVQVAFAFSQMTHFVSQAHTLLPVSSGEQLVFYTQHGERVTYALSPSHRILQTVRFPPDGVRDSPEPESHILVDRVASLSFQYLLSGRASPSSTVQGARCVVITLSMQQHVSSSFSTTICPGALNKTG